MSTAQFDPQHCVAFFKVHTRVLLRAQGQFKSVSGELQGSTKSGWRVLVQVDGRSLDFSGPAWMDRMTRSDEFLAIDRHPDIRFQSELFDDATLHAGGRLRGELVLRGLSRPVSFQLAASTCAKPGVDCDIRVSGSISRTEFGMNTHRFSLRDDVDLKFRVRLRAQAPP